MYSDLIQGFKSWTLNRYIKSETDSMNSRSFFVKNKLNLNFVSSEKGGTLWVFSNALKHQHLNDSLWQSNLSGQQSQNHSC